jgi:hypothetical protein
VGIFRRRPRPRHDPGVIYVLDRRADYSPYYSAVCKCGWFVEPVTTRYPDPGVEQRMAAAARDHDPVADENVRFPLDRPR